MNALYKYEIEISFCSQAGYYSLFTFAYA